MKRHTYTELCNSYALWMEYVDPSGEDTEEQFNARTMAERMEICVMCFGEEVVAE